MTHFASHFVSTDDYRPGRTNFEFRAQIDYIIVGTFIF